MRLGRRHWSIAAVMATAVAAGVLIAGPAAAAAPGPPTDVTSYPVLHGVGLQWQGDYSGTAPTVFTVYSRPNAGSTYTQIATVNASPTDHTASYIDGTIANGTSEQYAVTETTTGGESAKSAPVTAARPATDPIQGSDDAITVDAGDDDTLTSLAFDSSQQGSVTLTHDVLTGKAGDDTASATIPTVEGPGSYPINATDPLDLTTDGATCTTETGSIDVIDVAYDLNHDPVLFSASYTVSCDGGPTIYGDLRLNSVQPYRDLVVRPALVAGLGAPVGESAYVYLTITNVGTETTHVGSFSITGPQAGDWTLTSTSCENLTLSANGACAFDLLFSPSDRGHRVATLSFPDNTARGSHSVDLDGVGEVAPSAPPTTARIAVHEVQLSWSAPDDGGAPITEYDVYRTAAPQGQKLVAQIAPAEPDAGGTYTDHDLPTGATYTYSVVAQNAAGDSPDAVVTATLPDDEILLDATTAITTDGDEPVAVASPDIQGRVAVVPGGNRIVYPAKYSDGSVDLAIASAFGTSNQMRLTTIGGTDPAVSDDGTMIAFVHLSSAGEPSIWTVPLAGGVPTKVANDYTNPAWLPDAKSLVAEPATAAGQPEPGMPLVDLGLDGTATAIPGTTDGHEPAVSPDGNAIAYQLHSGDSYSLAVVPVGGGTPATSSATSNPIEDLSWRIDSAELFAAVDGRVKQAAYSPTAGPGALTTLSPPDVTGVRWPAYINSNAVSLLNPTAVTGKRPSVRIGTAADATSTCRLDGGAATPCDKSWNSVINLEAGDHTLVVSSTPDSGIASTVIWTFLVDTQKPTISLHHLPKKSHGKHVKIRYSGHDDNGVASYDVRYAKGHSKPGTGRYHYPHSWQATSRTTERLRVHHGTTYCFSARSRDVAGNLSKWSKRHCTAVK